MLAHLFGWIWQLFGAIALIMVLGYAAIAGGPKELNKHLDRGFEPIKLTRMERLRNWANHN